MNMQEIFSMDNPKQDKIMPNPLMIDNEWLKLKSIIPDNIDLYEEYKKIKKKQSKYSSRVRKAIVEEIEGRLNSNIKKKI